MRKVEKGKNYYDYDLGVTVVRQSAVLSCRFCNSTNCFEPCKLMQIGEDPSSHWCQAWEIQLRSLSGLAKTVAGSLRKQVDVTF